MTESCIEAADSLSIGLHPALSNSDSLKPHSRNRPYDTGIANATSRIIQSLETQVTQTLRKDKSVRIIRPNIAVSGVITGKVETGIGMVVWEENSDNVISESTTAPQNGNGTDAKTAEKRLARRDTSNNESLDALVQFTDQTVSLLNDLDEMSERDKVGVIFIPGDSIGLPKNVDNGKYHSLAF